MTVIVDYGMGNLGSILNMLKKAGEKAVVSSNPETIDVADRLILPGVGAFDNGMENLKRMNLIPLLNEKILVRKTPILGICLGMQLMSKSSEEGILPGLGWMDAETVRFKFTGDVKLKIPHMGWNTVRTSRPSLLFEGLDRENRFYFVHSYHVKCENDTDILSITKYSIDFASSICRDNIFGVQFHPEKSHKFGMTLLKNFVLMGEKK